MEMDDLEKLINELIRFVDNFPEPFRLETYKILLSKAITGLHFPESLVKPELAAMPRKSMEFELPSKVRAFLRQHRIEEDILHTLFIMKGDEVEPTYTIDITKKAQAQIMVAMLTALENALKEGAFEFSFDDVRERVKEIDAYVVDHFAHYFQKNKELFVGLDDKEHVKLSAAGKNKLAEIIHQLTH